MDPKLIRADIESLLETYKTALANDDYMVAHLAVCKLEEATKALVIAMEARKIWAGE
ncbi:MAG: hypothetical protein IK115_07840 [Lachnospiraceae bacterium]|nr:hypothetical protein [Lachnospiraceae bacterium]